MDIFENISEQAEAKRLLRAAIADEGPAHAYLFHGPPGVGKRATAIAFAGELIGDRGRVKRGSHPRDASEREVGNDASSSLSQVPPRTLGRRVSA